jgi:Spy/CpxP family protein refolding chaperone
MVGSSAGPAGRRRLWIGLFAVSLMLNLCFVGGSLWSWWHSAPERLSMTEHYRQIAAALDLDAGQRAAFDRYTAAMRSRMEQMRREVDPLFDAAWEEVAKPAPNEAAALALVDQAADKRRGFQHDATAATLEFLATLSPAQRAKFVALMRERRAALRHSRGNNRSP